MNTPSKTMWSIIDAARHTSGMRKSDLAKRIGVHPNTVSADSKYPERIPQERLWLYCMATGISVEDVIKTTIDHFANGFYNDSAVAGISRGCAMKG